MTLQLTILCVLDKFMSNGYEKLPATYFLQVTMCGYIITLRILFRKFKSA